MKKRYASGFPDILLFVPYARVPSPHGTGGGLLSYYDNEEFRRNVAAWFGPLAVGFEWQVVTPENVGERVRDAAARGAIVFNLCDGDDLNGYPGVSVIDALEAAGVPFTGSDSAFYRITTSKLAMKELFLRHGVPTAAYCRIDDPSRDAAAVERSVGFPAIVKPDVSYASLGIRTDSVVHDRFGASHRAARLLAGMHGMDFSGGIFAERFIIGAEYTVLVLSDGSAPGGLRVLPPIERYFHPSLPPGERFLAFERYWTAREIDDPSRLEGPEFLLPDGDPYYRYRPADPGLAETLSGVAARAYEAVGGSGYGRVDLRVDKAGAVYVLEVNANCGIDGAEEGGEVSAILEFAGMKAHELIGLVLDDALARRGVRRRKVRAGAV